MDGEQCQWMRWKSKSETTAGGQQQQQQKTEMNEHQPRSHQVNIASDLFVCLSLYSMTSALVDHIDHFLYESMLLVFQSINQSICILIVNIVC